MAFDYRFQSTHPLRDATKKDAVLMGLTMISIHAPLTGCDIQKEEELRKETISIHAPLTGCDRYHHSSYYHTKKHFNPRTPYGMRRSSTIIQRYLLLFQSTHPLRDATSKGIYNSDIVAISIHAPLTGCD